VLERIRWERVHSNGPAIVQELLVAAHAMGARIAEVPITFEERRAGTSTLNSKILLAGLAAQWRLLVSQPPVRVL
jgi:dolichol-phosphate mannosyltransferase